MLQAAERTGAAGGGNLTAVPDAQKNLGRATLVGGYMAGMEAMQQKIGKLKWADLLVPASYYADNGVSLQARTAGYFNRRMSVPLHTTGRQDHTTATITTQ